MKHDPHHPTEEDGVSKKKTTTKGAPVKKKTEKAGYNQLPYCVFALPITLHPSRMRDQAVDVSTMIVSLQPTLWLVQKGRKRASFTNVDAARAFAGKTGKIRAFVEVQA